MNLLKRFVRDESAAVAIEYSMIGVLMSIMLIAGATTIGLKINTHYVAFGSAMK